MGFIKLACPNCGADVELSEDREFGFCTYCGTKIAQDKVVVEHRGNVNVRGIANATSLLDRARLFLEGKDFDNAHLYCEKVLDIDPRNADAYIIKLLAQTKTTCIDDLSKLNKPLEKYDSYKKAIRFATQDKIDELVAANDSTKKNHTAEDERMLAELGVLNSNLREKQDKEKKASAWASIAKAIRIALILFYLVILCGVNRTWLSVLTLVLVIAGFVFIHLKKKESTKLKIEVHDISAEATSALYEYEQWKNWADKFER